MELPGRIPLASISRVRNQSGTSVMKMSFDFSIALRRLAQLLPLAVLLIVLAAAATLAASCSDESPETPEPTMESAPDDVGMTVSKDQPLAYAQNLVRQAIDHYGTDGREATIAYYNSEESLDGDWHVFILDEEGYIVSMAAFPSWVGVHDSDFTGHNHYPAGQMVIDGAREEGIQIDYLASGILGGVELKHLWAVKHDGLTFATSSWSGGPRPESDEPLYTQEQVRLAIGLYEASGLQTTLDYYNSPDSIDGQWYIFIADESERLIAHGANNDLVGMPLVDVKGANGYPSGQIVADDASADGAWSDYIFYSPSSSRSRVKHSWLVEHDGLIFGSGWYEDGPRKSDQPAYTQALVQQALDLYGSSGLEVALDYYSDPVSVDGQWYVFIVDTETGRTIGHFNPDLRHRDPSLRVDSTGYFYGDDLLGATESGNWIQYVITNPDNGEEQLKHTWAVLHNGYIFASGWYE